MKKILGIVVLGLLLSANALPAKTINIENRISLEVPNNYVFRETILSKEQEGFLEITGNDSKVFIMGTKSSVDFQELLATSEDEVFQPILDKLKKKNIRTQKAAINFMGKEIKKILKKKNYEGVIYIFLGKETIQELDEEISIIVDDMRNKNNKEIKDKYNSKYKKIFKEALNEALGSELKNLIKLTKFNIKNNQYNEASMSSKFSMNMGVYKMTIDFYGFVRNDKPIIILNYCLNKCPSNMMYIEKMILPISTIVNQTSKLKNNDLIDQLKTLSDLYKSGLLTKEEFEKAKKKLLN